MKAGFEMGRRRDMRHTSADGGFKPRGCSVDERGVLPLP